MIPFHIFIVIECKMLPCYSNDTFFYNHLSIFIIFISGKKVRIFWEQGNKDLEIQNGKCVLDPIVEAPAVRD
jgi:hypothetical protein